MKYRWKGIDCTLMVRAWSAVREALAKVSSSTKTALVRRSFWRDSRFDAISVRFVIAPFHRSLPPLPPFSSMLTRTASTHTAFFLYTSAIPTLHFLFSSFHFISFAFLTALMVKVKRNAKQQLSWVKSLLLTLINSSLT